MFEIFFHTSLGQELNCGVNNTSSFDGRFPGFFFAYILGNFLLILGFDEQWVVFILGHMGVWGGRRGVGGFNPHPIIYIIIWLSLLVLFVRIPFTAKPAGLDPPNFCRQTPNWM
jgi:hypothetical protein